MREYIVARQNRLAAVPTVVCGSRQRYITQNRKEYVLPQNTQVFGGSPEIATSNAERKVRSPYAPMPSHRPWCISYSKDIQRAGLSPVSSHLTRSHLGIWMSTRSERPDLQEQRNGPWDSRVIASGSGV